MKDENRKRAVVLSGGGGRGAYHVGVLKFLEEHEWFPDIIAGTSIGAVNGAAYASGHNANSLWSLWKRLTTADVQKTNWNLLDEIFLLDTAPLRKTLQTAGWVDFDRLNSNEAKVHLRVTATEISSGHLHVFGNSDDLYPSKMKREPLHLDHIIASCSIPIIYPATALHDTLFWDGATVANTPLGPAIDAGAEEIVVVLMTPWEDDDSPQPESPKNLLTAASMMLEWALLASFQADLKMFKRVNELVRLQVENARLQTANRLLMSQLRGAKPVFTDEDQDGVPDILQGNYHELPDPIIVSPQRAIPVQRIVRYTREGHEELYEMGYNDARRAWQEAGLPVEGRA